jgi:para-nitrobenzyl esterase
MKRKLFSIVLSLCFLFSLSIPSYSASKRSKNTPISKNSAAPLVKTPSGKVQGVSKDGVNIFKGIPFAMPPVGDLRFAPPKDVQPWKKTLKAENYGATAVQPQPIENLPMSEDCLNLNIWTPAGAKQKSKLPVYVWIHGGGFGVGTGAKKLYDGTNLAKQGIIVVTINYRLGALGYFASEQTYKQYGTTGNWGTLDQLKALEWINKNISAFGGDAKNITIGGESAGSYSVSALLLNPLAKNLFQKAIMESGDITALQFSNPYARSDMERTTKLNSVISSVFDVTEDNASGLTALRAADPNVLCQLTEFESDFNKATLFYVSPVFDGYAIPKDPVAFLKTGNFNKVKLLLGYNKDEGSLFIGNSNELLYKTLVYKMFGAEKAKAVLERFPVDKQHTALDRARQLVKLGVFCAGMKRFADCYAKDNLDVYMYTFTHETETTKAQGLGAYHGMELDYIFGNFINNVNPTEKDKEISKEMQTRFINFIKTGNPNDGEKLPSSQIWPKYSADTLKIMNFGETTAPVTIPEIDDIEFILKYM